jgi:RNA recognition motif-containing protein
MTSSLADSIFGSIQEKKNDSLFEASTKLPPKPNKLDFIESKPEREKRERKEEKKRKRKQNQEEKHGTDGTSEKQEIDGKEEGAEGFEQVNEEEERTIFVGNLPLDIKRTTLASMFKTCGKVKSARIRSVATAGVKVAPEHAGNQVRGIVVSRLHIYIDMLQNSHMNVESSEKDLCQYRKNIARQPQENVTGICRL